jgi:hypothetical protein
MFDIGEAPGHAAPCGLLLPATQNDAMKATEAIRLALRELADPACRRCRGRGTTGDDPVATLCACIRRRIPAGEAGTAGGEGGDALPHPWDTITRRAQEIHASALLENVPDTWS